MILTWLIAIPLIGGTLSWVASRRAPESARAVALAAAVAQLAAIALAAPPHGSLLEQRLAWIPAFGVTYHLALDGLSFVLLLLTGGLSVVAVACSWREITTRVGAFHFCLLAVVAGITGVFLARDLLLFYFFWELMLVPMYFLIGLWGHERRVYAAVKFFLFTFISSLLMLAAILGLAFFHRATTGVLTFDYADLLGTPLPSTAAMWLMLGFFVAFAVKLPALPFHTWLADAHTEAPTAGSVILAGLLLKTGAYGLLRFAIPLFPDAAAAFAPVAGTLGVVGILYGAMLAFAQSDLKRLVAYSSISHMGFVLLGLYAHTELAAQGAVVQMLAHGLSTGALFLLAGIVQERCGTRDLARLGGLWSTAPRLGGFMLFFAIAGLGLPGMVNFVGEFLVLLGAFPVFPALTVVAGLGFVASTVYSLRLVQASVHGPNAAGWHIPDLFPRELATLGALAVLVVWLGILPGPVFRTVGPFFGVEHRDVTGGNGSSDVNPPEKRGTVRASRTLGSVALFRKR